MSDPDLNQNSLKTDPVIKKFLAQIPPQIAGTFTDAQLTELKRIFGKRVNSSNQVNIRISIPFFKKGFYFVLLIGKDRRAK
jgi:hypothetical protein